MAKRKKNPGRELLPVELRAIKIMDRSVAKKLFSMFFVMKPEELEKLLASNRLTIIEEIIAKGCLKAAEGDLAFWKIIMDRYFPIPKHEESDGDVLVIQRVDGSEAMRIGQKKDLAHSTIDVTPSANIDTECEPSEM